MDELQNKLERVGLILYSALCDYLDVCTSIQNYYHKANAAGGVPRALSASVANEISLITSLYETKMKQAKSSLSQAINSSSVIVPINSLPSEILLRIFQLVVGERPCSIKLYRAKRISLPKYSEILSRVCTRWRHIAMGSPTLWSHIDFVPFSSRGQGFEARAEACVARAGDALLDIHIYDREVDEDFNMNKMLNLLTTAAPRIRSLEFFISAASEGPDRSLIGCCFGNCIPGTFTELAISDRSSTTIAFIRAADDPGAVNDLWLNVPLGNLEDLLLPVTVLRLDGIYLPWTYQVYQGLVELRLTCTRKSAAEISEEDLVTILLLSPGLRILYFGLILKTPRSGDFPMSPVRLDDLEALSWTSIRHHQLGTFLRLLSPGSKSLRLSFEPHVVRNQVECGDEIKDFFTRSNVVELYITNIAHGTYQMIGQLIEPIPNLRVLVINGAPFYPHHFKFTGNVYNRSAIPACAPLDMLYVTRARVELNKLEPFLRQYPANSLTFWDCVVSDGGNLQSGREIQTAFSRVCPAVRCISKDEPNPVKSWD